MHSPRGGKKHLGSEFSDNSRLSVKHLEEILDDLKTGGNRCTTKKTYYGIWKNFNKFLIRLDHIPRNWVNRVAIYCAYLIDISHLKSATVKSYVSAIKAVLADDGYELNMSKVLLASITKTCKMRNDRVNNRRPLQIAILEMALIQVERYQRARNQYYLEILYKTIFLVAYYGLFRIGELTESPHVIRAVDVHEGRNGTRFLFLLRSSKTHSRSDRPKKIKIWALDKDRTNGKLNLSQKRIFCPVKLLQEFTAIRKGYSNDAEQFFVFSDGSPVRAYNVRQMLKKAIDMLDLDSDLYNTHSFRIGRASDLLKLGLSVDNIKRQGRWKSNAVFEYLRD